MLEATKNTQTTKTVTLGTTRYGNPEPQMRLRFPKDTHYRVMKATLHKLAAELELATPETERWCVQAEDYYDGGRIYLDLSEATPAEAARGLALLKKVAG
jgi:hypothetical protein